MSVLCSQQPEECRFTHLLQPIRDLAANWDINIANELEEYLGVLEQITFSFDGGPSLNFAEAALLIQGSACVYSKKVEHLHSLVYQALNFIGEKRKQSGGGGQKQVDDVVEFEDEEAFLNLDDILQEGTGIDLEDGNAAPRELPIKAPTVVLALEDSGHGESDGGAGSYRIATCSVHKSGALLLEAHDGDLMDEQMRLCDAVGPTHLRHLLGEDLQSHAEEETAGPSGAEGEPIEQDIYDGGDGFAGDDDDDGGAMQPLEPAESMPAHGAEPPWLEGADEGHVRQARSRLQPAHRELFDPYAPLDHHDAGSMPQKPFKKMKPRSRRRAPKVKAPAVDAFAPPQPSAPSQLTFPEFEYVLRARAALEQAQLRGSRKRGEHLWRDAQGSAEEQQLSAFQPEDGEQALPEEAEYEGGFDDNGDDDGFGVEAPFDDAGGDMDMTALAQAAAEGGFPAGVGAWQFIDQDGEPSYEDRCRMHIETLMAAAAEAEVQTGLAARVASWRDKLAPVLEEQDARGDFDIHAYGEVVLEDLAKMSLADPSNPEELRLGKVAPVTFERVAHREHKWQVSRLFSALLQLANNGNVILLRGSDPSQPFSLRLASLDRPHQQFEDYRAPSFLQNKDLNAPEPAAKGAQKEVQAASPVAGRKVTVARKGPKRRKGCK
ncbi:Condensin-2 complex subunit H2 [Coccomyxa sp. Obi]|nr:Condensin-2 complex subunit H2 [Coccomyxa sp. Obi]